jgi:hypothetical protein
VLVATFYDFLGIHRLFSFLYCDILPTAIIQLKFVGYDVSQTHKKLRMKALIHYIKIISNCQSIKNTGSVDGGAAQFNFAVITGTFLTRHYMHKQYPPVLWNCLQRHSFCILKVKLSL